jgi:hypothetical protein
VKRRKVAKGRRTESFGDVNACHCRGRFDEDVSVLTLLPRVLEKLIEPLSELEKRSKSDMEVTREKDDHTFPRLSLKKLGENILFSTLNFIRAPGSPPAVRCSMPNFCTHSLYLCRD